MKYLFLVLLLILLIASVGTYWSLPESRSAAPVIYWVTDSNPARLEQVRLFQEWIKKNEYPPVELRLDMANRDLSKLVIQGVSGVAGDLIDLQSGGDLRYFRALGLNSDLTDDALRMGFDPSQTYPRLLGEITMPDARGNPRQYQFPCNVSALMYWVNRQAFAQYNQPLPPDRWTLEDFERRGRAFVRAANRNRARPTVFFADMIPVEAIRASLGGSRFNETGTRCTLDEAPAVEALELAWKWTFKDQLVPTAADRSSFTVDSGYGGVNPQLFINNFQPERGQVAMLWTGRYLLIQFRQADQARRQAGQPPLELGVTEPPHGGFPNTTIATRAAMIYAGSKHRDLANYFLKFLASEDYNLQIVRDADSLPPNPKYTQIREFTHPPDHPGEWGVHEPFARAATDLAVGTSYSPFIFHSTADRLELIAREKFLQETPLAGFETPYATAHEQTRLINLEIARAVESNSALAALYDKLSRDQAVIDEQKRRLQALQSAGQPIPEEARIDPALIQNAFHLAYYRWKGWLKTNS